MNTLVCVRGIIVCRAFVHCTCVSFVSLQKGTSDIADPKVVEVNKLVCVTGVPIICICR